MIGILDPALLLPRSEAEEALVEAELDGVVRICREGRVDLLELEEYWPELWRQHGLVLERSLSSRRARQALGELRKRARPPRGVPPLQPAAGRVYGLRQLFDLAELGPGWLGRMTNALARATASGVPTVLITRRMEGRNLRRHQAGESRLDETTRWVLYLHMSGNPPSSVPCVHHPRSLSPGLRFTTRYDWRLPSTADDARYPFCPPAEWWRRSVDAVTTMSSKPVFLDAKGNGWARPNIEGGQGYHWDVYIANVSLAEQIGLSQLNIVEAGAPAKEGAPGSIHHTPAKKKPHLRDTGWRC